MYRKFFAVSIALFLTLVLSSVFIYGSSPQDDFIFSFYDDDYTADVNSYLGSEDQVEIPDTYVRPEFVGGVWIFHHYTVNRISEGAFRDTDVVEVTIPDTVTYMGENVFEDCSNLKIVDIGDGVENILSGTFFNCVNLETFIPGNSLAQIHANAFGFCESLELVEISENVDYIDTQAFVGCINLDRISVHTDNAHYASDEAGVLFSKDMEELMIFPRGKAGQYTVPGHVIEIADFAFDGSINLTGVTIPDNVTRIGEYAFAECINLESAVIPGHQEEIPEGMFFFCISLESIDLSDSLLSIGRFAFFNCERLETVKIPESVNQILGEAFANCSNLKKAVFLGDAPSTVGDRIFDDVHPDFKIYYYQGAQNWTNPWNGYPTVMIPDPTPTPTPETTLSPVTTAPSEEETEMISETKPESKTPSDSTESVTGTKPGQTRESGEGQRDRISAGFLIVSIIVIFSMILIGAATALIIYIVMGREKKETVNG